MKIRNQNLSVSSFSREITYRFITFFSVSAGLIQIVQILRDTQNPELWDKVLVVLPVAVCFFLFFGGSKKDYAATLPSVIAIVFIVVGVIAIETHSAINGVDINKILWFGFGIFVFAVTVCLLPSSFSFFVEPGRNRLIRYLLVFGSIAVLLLLLPATWQGGSSLMEPDAPEYVINELLAVPAGNLPYVDFIPQYGILFTWLIAPFEAIFSPEELVTFGLYLMSAATIIAVLLGVWLVYQAMNKRSLPLAVLLVVPFTSIAQFPGRESYSGSIFSNPTQVPIRLLVPLIASAFLIRGLIKKSSKDLNLSFVFLGIGLWANTDFALAATFSAFGITFLNRVKVKEFGIALASLVGGFASYPILLMLFGKPLDLSGFATFIRQFGGGYGSEPIQTPGPVLVVLPLIVAIFFASALPLYRERFKKQEIPSELKRAVLTANFFSAWSLIGFAYYLNRSYASGQMQILFLPLAIAMASFFYYVLPKNIEEIPWTAKTFFKKQTWSGKKAKTNLAYIPVAMLMALPLATTIAFPSPAVEYERLTNAPAENRWPLPKNSQAFAEFPKVIQGIPKGEIEYFGSSGNYVEMTYGVNNLTIFNSPFDLFMSQNMIDKGCQAIFESRPKYLLINDTGLMVSSNFQDQKLCGIYRPTENFPNRLLELIE